MNRRQIVKEVQQLISRPGARATFTQARRLAEMNGLIAPLGAEADTQMGQVVMGQIYPIQTSDRTESTGVPIES